ERHPSPAQYNKFFDFQFRRSKEVLDKKLGNHVRMLGWPYGIYDNELTQEAKQAGYTSAFALDGRHAGDADNIMAISRYLVTDRDLECLLEEVPAGPPARP
ncbi:MAG: polysaccharide deacetylase family protein, partial [Acidobacteriota bacterium]